MLDSAHGGESENESQVRALCLQGEVRLVQQIPGGIWNSLTQPFLASAGCIARVKEYRPEGERGRKMDVLVLAFASSPPSFVGIVAAQEIVGSYAFRNEALKNFAPQNETYAIGRPLVIVALL